MTTPKEPLTPEQKLAKKVKRLERDVKSLGKKTDACLILIMVVMFIAIIPKKSSE